MASIDDVKRKPGYKAANAARILGGLLVAVMTISTIFAARGMVYGPPRLAEAALILAVLALCLSPGIALLVMAPGVRRGARGRTIATMVLGIVIGAYLALVTVAQIVSLTTMNGGRSQTSTAELVFLGVVAIFALVAVMLVVYCIQSLRFPDHNVTRGFEPLMETPPPVAMTATEAAGDGSSVNVP